MPTKSIEEQFINANLLPISNPDDVRPVYANHVGASATATDFRLFFNEVGTLPEGVTSKQTHEVKSIVVLPLASAAVLVSLLQQVLANHQVLAANSEKAGKVG